MLVHLRSSLFLLLTMTVLTGVAYPLTVTAIGHLLFSHQATGSLIRRADQVIGSELVGQNFTRPEYFWGRLSATASSAYNAAASSGSNYGPSNPALLESAQKRIAQLKSFDNVDRPIPVDLVTASASGLDPHITPAAAEFQVSRVAKYRNMSSEALRKLVAKHTMKRSLGILGEPCVNVLLLNLELDQIAGTPSSSLQSQP